MTAVLALTGRRLAHLRHAPGRLVGITFNPLVSMLVLGFLFQSLSRVPGMADYRAYLFAGAAVQVGLAGIGPTALAVSTDLRGGLVDRFRSLPIARMAVLFGHTTADFVVGLAATVVVTGFGLLLGWQPNGTIADTAAAFGILALFTYVMVWVGALLGLLIRNVESIGSISSLVVVVLPFLSTAFVVPADVPALLRPVIEWNPLSAVIDACRGLWGNEVAGTAGGGGAGFAVVSLLLVFAGVWGWCTWLWRKRE